MFIFPRKPPIVVFSPVKIVGKFIYDF